MLVENSSLLTMFVSSSPLLLLLSSDPSLWSGAKGLYDTARRRNSDASLLAALSLARGVFGWASTSGGPGNCCGARCRAEMRADWRDGICGTTVLRVVGVRIPGSARALGGERWRSSDKFSRLPDSRDWSLGKSSDSETPWESSAVSLTCSSLSPDAAGSWTLKSPLLLLPCK